jgi:hypothetical protein
MDADCRLFEFRPLERAACTNRVVAVAVVSKKEMFYEFCTNQRAFLKAMEQIPLSKYL